MLSRFENKDESMSMVFHSVMHRRQGSESRKVVMDVAKKAKTNVKEHMNTQMQGEFEAMLDAGWN